MKPPVKRDALRQEIEKDIVRGEKYRREKRAILAQTIFLGAIGVMIAFPIVLGAYLGRWLDSKMQGFSVSWTMSFIVIGLAVGVFNVIYFIKRH